MDYGEGEWKQKALLCLDRMETFSEETRNAFKKTLDWLCQWACSRSFGLGSRLPWDPEWLIESLSDSTIYMAYYTVAHILQGGVIDGSKPGPAGVVPDQMTDSVWSYIMLEGPLPNDSTIAQETLFLMRSEFQYFYPLDLRCSGKDLINNHLTFFLYNHTAIFPEKNWPKAIRANGHLLLNNEKMSKSTGNFLTVGEAMDRYGADATRFALADAGDGIEDANFLEKTADDAILKLHTELEWIQENISASSDNRTGQITWNDQVFAAEMDKVIVEAKTAYESMLYREALKVSFYDLQNVRNEYRKATTGQGLSLSTSEVFEGMHRDLVVRFAETLALLLSPITPHWSEGVWMEILKKGKSIMHSRWPTVASDKSSENLLSAAKYVQGLGARIRSAEDAAKKKSKKKVVESPGPKVIRVFVAEKYPVWQDQVMNVLKSSYNPESREFSGKERDILKECGLLSNKQVMPFVAKIKVYHNLYRKTPQQWARRHSTASYCFLNHRSWNQTWIISDETLRL